MTKQQLRQVVLVLVIACQALAGSLASAASVMGPADRAHCDSDAMSMSAMSGPEHGGHAMHQVAGSDAPAMADTTSDHACDNGCCCPSACSSAAALLPQSILLLDDGNVTPLVLITPSPADLRVADPLRPPIIA